MCSQTQPIVVPQRRFPTDQAAVDSDPIATAQIDDASALFIDQDARVLPRNERVFDRNLTLGTSPDDDLATMQVELLQ